ncbi:amidase [Paucihalobacter ruber]|uniref:Amidase n=1 Tax=Paucihalobacter ruber TaxID=2567861 RepID=A0A506PKG7_9FLAO|nr:amidase family protein [Paucihalobacter ruber]TPV33998.1 amidase [Paucihalobacter ruber]
MPLATLKINNAFNFFSRVSQVLILLVFVFLLSSCKNSNNKKEEALDVEVSESDDSTDISAISTKQFREFEVLDSRHISRLDIWTPINSAMSDFTAEDYERLKPLVLDQDILTLQSHITKGNLSYELLTKFYLYRIREFDRENDLSLNSVISINPTVIVEAKMKDQELKYNPNRHAIYGMPILLKDNVNASGMSTTAGAVALRDNRTSDAFLVQQIKKSGGLILGKANLSEWAYFFCGNCPSGYSALGGQTLNPYGRKMIDTGGSSSGSAVAVAANFCAAAVGSETSGSILSPSSQNSVVGLKPTVGLVSRSGVIPISETLDTAGPIAKTVGDAAILLDAMYGYDKDDKKAIRTNHSKGFYYSNLEKNALEGKRFAAVKRLMEDSLYLEAVEKLKELGATIVEIDETEASLPNFLRLLNLDMKKDLPAYMSNYANPSVKISNVQDVINFNSLDSINFMPYGQALFRGIVSDKGDTQYLRRIRDTLKTNGRKFFEQPFNADNLDGFLSINNYHAGYAAVAEYPAITVPMGYAENGAPKGLTFIARPNQEKNLLKWAKSYEQASKKRIAPKNYN